MVPKVVESSAKDPARKTDVAPRADNYVHSIAIQSAVFVRGVDTSIEGKLTEQPGPPKDAPDESNLVEKPRGEQQNFHTGGLMSFHVFTRLVLMSPLSVVLCNFRILELNVGKKS